MPSEITAYIMDRIIEKMRTNKITANELAEKAELRKGIVTDWKTGRANISVENLFVISTIFNCNVSDFFPCNNQTSTDEQMLLYYYKLLDDFEKKLLLGNLQKQVGEEGTYFRKEKSLNSQQNISSAS